MRERAVAARGPVTLYEGRSIFVLGIAGQHEHKCLIKVLSRRALDDEQAVVRFAREAVLGYELTHVHPNLLTTRDFGTLPDGRLFLVTDYEPVTIEQVRDKIRGDLPAIRVVAHAVLSALVYLHHQGLAHGAVTTGSIHLSWDGAVVLSDLSNVVMAERFLTNDVGGPDAAFDTACRHDLYELGHVLQQLITGVVTPEAAAACRSLPDILPRDLRELVTRLLRPAEDPPHEPFTADEAFVQLRRSRELFAPRDHLMTLLAGRHQGPEDAGEVERAVSIDVDDDDDTDDPDPGLTEDDREQVTAAIRAVLLRLEKAGERAESGDGGDGREEDGGSDGDASDDANGERSERLEATDEALAALLASSGALVAGAGGRATAVEVSAESRKRGKAERRRRSSRPSALGRLLASVLGGLGAGAAAAAVLVLSHSADSLRPNPASSPAVVASRTTAPDPSAAPDSYMAERASAERVRTVTVTPGHQLAQTQGAGASVTGPRPGPVRGEMKLEAPQLKPSVPHDDIVLLTSDLARPSREPAGVQVWIVNRGVTAYQADNVTLLDARHQPAEARVTEFKSSTTALVDGRRRAIPAGEMARITLEVKDQGVLSGEYTILVSEAGGRRPAAVTGRRVLP